MGIVYYLGNNILFNKAKQESHLCGGADEGCILQLLKSTELKYLPLTCER